MIIDKIKELVGLIQAQRMLSLSRNDANIANIMTIMLISAGLFLILDYGYMLYLHYKMVRP